MKKKLLCMVLCVMTVMGFTACNNDDGDGRGLSVSMNLPEGDAAGDTRLWIYRSDGDLLEEYHYESFNLLAQQRYDLPTGEYVLIAANNLTEPFTATKSDAANGVKPYEALLFSLNDASASPAHAHYGVQKVSVNAGTLESTEVKMNRILAELQFTIKGVPSDVIRVEAKITNVAKSFLPYSGELLPLTDVADLGSETPQNGVISFSMKRVMPVVAPAKSRADAEVKTQLQFTFHYIDNSTIEFTATAPIIENGGSYIPEVDYGIFRPGLEVTITDINGWIKGETSEGELLNPDR